MFHFQRAVKKIYPSLSKLWKIPVPWYIWSYWNIYSPWFQPRDHLTLYPVQKFSIYHFLPLHIYINMICFYLQGGSGSVSPSVKMEGLVFRGHRWFALPMWSLRDWWHCVEKDAKVASGLAGKIYSDLLVVFSMEFRMKMSSCGLSF